MRKLTKPTPAILIISSIFVLVIPFFVFLNTEVGHGNLRTYSNIVSAYDKTASTTYVDWWTMLGHDSHHAGYSSSKAPRTDNILWTFETDSYIASSPAVVDGVVYIGSDDYTLYAIDAETGNLKWKYRARNTTSPTRVHSSPTVADGKVFMCAYDTIYAVDKNAGTLLWTYKTGDSIESSPVVSYGKVFVTMWNKGIVALDAISGNLLWSYETAGGGYRCSPATADGKVYVGLSGYLYALNAENGSIVWKTGLIGNILTPAIEYSKVFVSCSVNNSNYYGLYALNAFTGKIIWSREIDVYTDSSPAVAYNKVFVGGKDKVFAFDQVSGNLLWSYNGDLNSSPAIADGVVFAGVSENLCAFKESTGEVLWSYMTWGTVSSPAIADDKLFATSTGHKKLFCFCTFDHDLKISDLQIPLPAYPDSELPITVTIQNRSSLNDEYNIEVQFLVDGKLISSTLIPALNRDTGINLSFNWRTPSSITIHELAFNIVPVAGETYTYNNIILKKVAVGGKSIKVPADYSTIQQAVNAADPGDTVEITAGTYCENVLIEKDHLVLLGENPDNTIIDGKGREAILILSNSTVVKNLHIIDGGYWNYEAGLIVFSSNNEISNCILSDGGNGILIRESSLNNTIINCRMFNNAGHGISLYGTGNIVEGCILSSNGQDTQYSDSAILLHHPSSNVVKDCLIYGNIDDGVQVVGGSSNKIINCNIFFNGQAGISIEHFQTNSRDNEIRDCNIWNNGIGITIDESYNTFMRGNSLWNNTYNFGVQGSGTQDYQQDIDTSNTIDGKPIYYLVNIQNIIFDGVLLDPGYIALIDCSNIVVRNLNLTNNMHGLFLSNTNDVQLYNCNISKNQHGIKADNCSEINIYHCDFFENNTAVYFDYGYENSVIECNLLNNECGIYLGVSTHHIEVFKCNILFNKEGIISHAARDSVIRQCNISSNNVGLYMEGSSNQKVISCMISNNQTDGIYLEYNQECSFINDTIVFNGERGVFCNQATNYIINSIVWNNSTNLSGQGLNVTYSNIENGFTGTGNISADPAFRDPTTADYHLKPGSLCIDAGLNAIAPANDFEGDPVPYDGNSDSLLVADIGADEYLPKGYIQGRVILQGRHDYSRALIQCGPYSVLSDSGGNFSLHVMAGSYTLSVYSPGYLYFERSGIAVDINSTIPIAPIVLLAGDIYEDGVINIYDLVSVAFNFNSANFVADVNGSGLVDIQDLALVALNFGMSKT